MKLSTIIGILLCLFLMPLQILAQKKKKSDQLFTLTTKFGEIKFILFDETPIHKENFLQLTKEGSFDSTLFHRVIKDFMIQGGDLATRPGSSEKSHAIPGKDETLEAEIFCQFTHIKGSIAAARMGDQVNPERRSSKSQFYIVHNKKGTPHLDGGYTVFGQVIQGLDIVDKIASQPISQPGNRPKENIYMTMTAKKIKKKKLSKDYGYSYPVYDSSCESTNCKFPHAADANNGKKKKSY